MIRLLSRYFCLVHLRTHLWYPARDMIHQDDMAGRPATTFLCPLSAQLLRLRIPVGGRWSFGWRRRPRGKPVGRCKITFRRTSWTGSSHEPFTFAFAPYSLPGRRWFGLQLPERSYHRVPFILSRCVRRMIEGSGVLWHARDRGFAWWQVARVCPLEVGEKAGKRLADEGTGSSYPQTSPTKIKCKCGRLQPAAARHAL